MSHDCCSHTHDHLPSQGYVFVSRIDFCGWPGAYKLSNGLVEAVFVPQIGRLVSLRFLADESDALWLNPELHGASPAPDGPDWSNFGGDKCWPSPQDDWAILTPRGWPPPPAFDSLAVDVTADDGLTIVSPIDPHYGLRTRRRIELDANQPELSIVTEFEKISGPPVSVGVWVITQTPSPEKAFLLLPETTSLDNGCTLECGPLPAAFERRGRLIALERGLKEFSKIGAEGSQMLWLGPSLSLRIATNAEDPSAAFNYPRCQTEIYTNPDPLPYIELETQGPIRELKVGDTIRKRNVYTLGRRIERDPWREAERIFGL